MKIVVLYQSESGCSFHRLLLPFRYFPDGHEIVFIEAHQGSVPVEIFEGANFVVFNRASPFDIEVLKIWRQHLGFKIICDLDDYWELYPTHVEYENWKKIGVGEKLMESLVLADGVMTTNRLLRDRIGQFNKNVEVFENGLPFEKEQFYAEKNTVAERMSIIYVGGVSHYHDLKTIQPTINRLNELPQVDFIAAGYNDEGEKTKRVWEGINNIIKGCRNSYYKKHLPLDKYMSHYSIGNCAVAPLADNYFNKFKSGIKVIEAGCKHLPIICSNIPPYSNLNGVEGVYLAKNNKEWYNIIKHLVKNPTEIEKSGIKLGEYVRKHYNVENISKRREQWLFSIIE